MCYSIASVLCFGMVSRHVGSELPDQGSNMRPCTGSIESSPLDYQRSPISIVLNHTQLVVVFMTAPMDKYKFLRGPRGPQQVVATSPKPRFQEEIERGTCSTRRGVSFIRTLTTAQRFNLLNSASSPTQPENTHHSTCSVFAHNSQILLAVIEKKQQSPSL